MYQHDSADDWFECYGSSRNGFKVRHGDYVYYFRTIDHFKVALSKMDICATSHIPLLHHAWFVVKNDNTVVKSRLLIEDMIDIIFPIMIEKDNKTLTKTEQNT